jgi:hypothetical protein
MQDHLKSQLDKLHTDLSEVEPTTPEARGAVHSLRTTVREVLDQGDIDASAGGETLYQRLKDSLLHLEAAHPTLAADIQNLIDTLVKIGV